MLLTGDLGNRVGMAQDYNNIGVELSNLGNYQEALEYHNKASAIDEDLGNRVGMAQDYNNIGNVFYSLGNYHNYQEALNTIIKLGLLMKI